MELLLYILAREMSTPLPLFRRQPYPNFVLLSLGDNHLGYEFYVAGPQEAALLKEYEEKERREQTDRAIMNQLVRLRSYLFGVDKQARVLHRESLRLNAIRARYLESEPCALMRGRIPLQPFDRQLVNRIRAYQEPDQPSLL